MTETPFTPISEVGEFGLIDRLDALIGKTHNKRVLLGIGDDAAVVEGPSGSSQLITTDALIEGVHFDRTFTPLEMLGFKAIAANVSDIAAMNGQALYAVVALGLPNNMSVEMVEALYRGMTRACDAYGVALVGGDTTAARVTVLSVTVIGEAREGEVCFRSGARPGDVLCVTGDLGAAYAGLKVLQEQKRLLDAGGDDFDPAVLQEFAHCVQRHLMPQARVDVVREWGLRRIVPSALIDVSDGLASEIHHLCNRSQCGARIASEAIPLDDQTLAVARLFGDDPTSYALYGGEDYQLLFTVSEDQLSLLDDQALVVLGTISEARDGVMIDLPGGDTEPLVRQGFEHF